MGLGKDLQDNVIKAERYQLFIDREIIKRYEDLRQMLKEEMAVLYVKYGDSKTGYLSADALRRYKRLEAFEKKIASEYKKQLLKKDNLIKNSVLSQYKEGYYRTAWALENEAKLDMFRALSNEQVKEAVFTEISKLSDSTLMSLDRAKDIKQMQTNILNALNQTTDHIRFGIIKGESFVNMAKRIDKVLGFRDADGRVIKLDKKGQIYKSLRVARTEGHAAYANAQVALYDKAKEKGIEVKRILMAVIDSRTRQQSLTVNGNIADKDGYFDYPNGYRFRSPGEVTVPAWRINDREYVRVEVDGYEPVLKRQRDPSNNKNKIVPFRSYSTWIKNKKVKSQIITGLPDFLARNVVKL